MPSDIDLVTMFKAELGLCKMGEGNTLAILSEDSSPEAYVNALLAAADVLKIDAFNLNIRKRPGSFFGPGNSLAGREAAIRCLQTVDMVVDLVGLLWSREQTKITEAGPRMLLMLEPPEILQRMFPTTERRQRVESAAELLGRASTLRITSTGGTDVTYTLGQYGVVKQYGYTDEPGRWDHFPGAFLYTGANDGEVKGTVVIDRGDILLPFMRYVNNPIRLTVEEGMVTAIEGDGVDAEIMRDFMAGFDDPQAYAVSHIGWGLDETAQWNWLGTSPVSGIGMDGRSFLGNVLFSTGPNTELGGRNDTLCHLDIPLRNCSLFLDGQAVIEDGQLAIPELRVS